MPSGLRTYLRNRRALNVVLSCLFFLGTVLLAPPLEAGTDPDRPAPAPLPVATGPASPGPAASTDPLAIDPVEIWMANYHRNPTPDEIRARVGTLVGRGAFATDSPRAREYLRFFAAALAAEPDAIPAVQRFAETAAEPEKAVLAGIVAQAGHYAPPVVEKPEDLPQLWADYRATGRESSLKALIDLVGLEESADPGGLAKAAVGSLLEQVPRQVPALQILNDSFHQAAEPLKTRLAPTAATLNQWHDLASTLNTRGRNHVRAKQPEEAINAYLAAMAAFPAFHAAYFNLTDLNLDADRKGDFQKALAAMQIAAALEPDDAAVLARLGRVYYRMELYDQANVWFLRAQECNPKYDYAVAMLGKIALKKDDRDAALRHFTRYLKLEPGGENLAKRDIAFLATAGITVGAAAEPTLATLLQKRQHDRIEERLSSLIREKRKTESGASAVIREFDALTDLPGPEGSSEYWVRQFRDWVSQRPQSPVAATALGLALVNYAWEARGHGWANTVLEERGRLFTERLLEARQALELACNLDPADPAGPNAMINVVKGLGLGREEMERQYQRALKADDSLLEPATAKMIALLPKWGGSADEALAFSRAAAAAAPAGSAVPLVLTSVHRELDLDLQNTRRDRWYYRAPGVWKELKPVFERHLAAFPEAIVTRNWYAWAAWRAGDFETALRELDRIGDEWDPAVWDNFTALKRARKEMAAR